ncbi:MAG: hypothetical protein U0270_15875 [Labilithrix sp.]
MIESWPTAATAEMRVLPNLFWYRACARQNEMTALMLPPRRKSPPLVPFPKISTRSSEPKSVRRKS